MTDGGPDWADLAHRLSGWLGRRVSPGQTKHAMRVDWIETGLGPMVAASSATALHLLEFVERDRLAKELQTLDQLAKGELGLGRHPPIDLIEDELARYDKGQLTRFETPIDPIGTPFQRRVWQALRDIPFGTTQSYGAFAASLDRPDAIRAVARANGANPIAIVIPCHRLVGKNGALTGYGGGLWRKKALLAHEAAHR